MPIKDVVLSSVTISEDSNSDDLLFKQVTVGRISNKEQFNIESLTPPELAKQYEYELMQNLEADASIFSKTKFFLKNDAKKIVNETKIQILEEHSYCKKQTI
jgi:hypothetical protein